MRTERAARPHSVLSPPHLSTRLALAASLVLHPFVLSPATVLLLSRRSSALAYSLAIVIPMFVLTAVQVRRGRWTNYDVSVRTQRRGLYWPALLLTLAGAAVLYATGDNPGLLRGFLVAAGMITAAMFINRFMKISLHMTFAAFNAILLGWRFPAATVAFAIAAALTLLAWSRLHLERHTWAEVLAGTALGAAAGAVLVLG